MMREFKDKYRQARYYPGDVYESDEADRIAFLSAEGYLGEAIPPTPPAEQAEKVKPNGSTKRRKNGVTD